MNVDECRQTKLLHCVFSFQQYFFSSSYSHSCDVCIYVVGHTQESYQEERADQGDLRQDESTCCQLNWLTHQHTTVIN
jgi:hypothetical protein